jgi:uncharacterized protein YktA (UPF0223 family)
MTDTINFSIVSVIMKNEYDLYKLVQKYEGFQKGVFSISDLKNLFNEFNEVSLYKKIKNLQKKSILNKFCRGFYTTDNFSLETLTSRINKNSYISLGYILAQELIIGSIPRYTITCIKLGKKRTYSSKKENINYLGICPQLFFGFVNKAGVNYALKEKAFLDTLYFYQKGYKFSFNIFSDINCNMLDKKIIYKFLNKYNNPKFVSFAKNYLNEKNS